MLLSPTVFLNANDNCQPVLIDAPVLVEYERRLAELQEEWRAKLDAVSPFTRPIEVLELCAAAPIGVEADVEEALASLDWVDAL
ncbi:MAG: hypothetical protein ACK4GK_07230 [Ferrovibrio sp.]